MSKTKVAILEGRLLSSQS